MTLTQGQGVVLVPGGGTVRIKEVENATGLTAKAIRLYESKGLLQVAREQENDYRDYSEEDVERLKGIALLRQLDVPLKSIKEWTEGKRSVQSLLDQVRSETEKSSRESRIKKKLLDALEKAMKNRPDAPLPELMDDVRDLNQIMEQLQELPDQGDISVPLWWSMMCLGPIGMMLLYITTIDAEVDQLIIGFFMSLIMVVVAAFSWYRYFTLPRSDRKVNTGWLERLLIAILAIGCMFGLMYCLTEIQNGLYCANEKAIVLARKPWSYSIILVELEIIAALFAIKEKPWKERRWKISNVLAGFGVVLVVNAVLVFGFITSVSVATDDNIVRYSMTAPSGESYDYDDIVSVETGFGDKFLGIPVRGTGRFYYRITYSDGTTEDWGECSSDWDEDSWQWMIRLDELVMAGGAEKNSSAEYSEYCDMDQVYVDMLLEVIRNK